MYFCNRKGQLPNKRARVPILLIKCTVLWMSHNPIHLYFQSNFRQREELEKEQHFQHLLFVEASGLERGQDISRPWVYSYFQHPFLEVGEDDLWTLQQAFIQRFHTRVRRNCLPTIAPNCLVPLRFKYVPRYITVLWVVTLQNDNWNVKYFQAFCFKPSNQQKQERPQLETWKFWLFLTTCCKELKFPHASGLYVSIHVRVTLMKYNEKTTALFPSRTGGPRENSWPANGVFAMRQHAYSFLQRSLGSTHPVWCPILERPLGAGGASPQWSPGEQDLSNITPEPPCLENPLLLNWFSPTSSVLSGLFLAYWSCVASLQYSWCCFCLLQELTVERTLPFRAPGQL